MYALVFAELTGEAALIQLEACCTPKDTVTMLVATHKVGAFLHLGPLLFVGITHRIDRLLSSSHLSGSHPKKKWRNPPYFRHTEAS